MSDLERAYWLERREGLPHDRAESAVALRFDLDPKTVERRLAWIESRRRSNPHTPRVSGRTA
jgi:hypothetical protein